MKITWMATKYLGGSWYFNVFHWCLTTFLILLTVPYLDFLTWGVLISLFHQLHNNYNYWHVKNKEQEWNEEDEQGVYSFFTRIFVVTSLLHFASQLQFTDEPQWPWKKNVKICRGLPWSTSRFVMTPVLSFFLMLFKSMYFGKPIVWPLVSCCFSLISQPHHGFFFTFIATNLLVVFTNNTNNSNGNHKPRTR